MKKAELNKKITELEQKVCELDGLAKKLEGRLSCIKEQYDNLLFEYGNKIRESMHNQVEKDIDDIEYRILKKLVDGDIFELKMKDN